MTAQIIDMTNKHQETVEANYAGKPVKAAMSDLLFWWQDGYLNTASFIFLALKLDGIGSTTEEEFDVIEWCQRWETPENDKGKTKIPKPKEVMTVLQKIQANGQGQINIQMTLRLDI
jgi:hypothetical protein